MYETWEACTAEEAERTPGARAAAPEATDVSSFPFQQKRQAGVAMTTPSHLARRA